MSDTEIIGFRLSNELQLNEMMNLQINKLYLFLIRSNFPQVNSVCFNFECDEDFLGRLDY
jgi:uncharacterized protein (UPF0216 family)